jgi:hypothetical protein
LLYYRLTVIDADAETDSTTATVTVNAGKFFYPKNRVYVEKPRCETGMAI